jgi:hypothetical protein
MLTEPGLNDLISAVNLTGTAWETGTWLPFHGGPLQPETLTAPPILQGIPYTVGVYRIRGVEGLPAVLRQVAKFLTLLTLGACTSHLRLQRKLTQSTASSMSFCWSTAIHRLFPLFAELTLPILFPSHLAEERDRFFLSILGWLSCVVNICASGAVLFDFDEFCCAVLVSFLKKLSNFSFSGLVPSSFSSHL